MNKTSAFALTVSATLLPVMGFVPHIVMDGLADMGQGFMQVQNIEKSIAYFSLTNLKGAAISLIIGVLVYLVIVRLWMMRPLAGKAADTHDIHTASVAGSSVFVVLRKKEYVNRWNMYLDLENLVYRPILLRILPFLFGVLCRVLDSFVDTIVILLRKTLYRDSKLPHELPEGTPLTHMTACIAAFFQQIGNKTFRRKNPVSVDYDHKFAMINEEWAENRTMIARSMSFGLLLFCIGLLTMIGYLFIMDIF